MCQWRCNFFTKCGHQPAYVETLCSHQKSERDTWTRGIIMQACGTFNIPEVQNLDDICPDCTDLKYSGSASYEDPSYETNNPTFSAYVLTTDSRDEHVSHKPSLSELEAAITARHMKEKREARESSHTSAPSEKSMFYRPGSYFERPTQSNRQPTFSTQGEGSSSRQYRPSESSKLSMQQVPQVGRGGIPKQTPNKPSQGSGSSFIDQHLRAQREPKLQSFSASHSTSTYDRTSIPMPYVQLSHLSTQHNSQRPSFSSFSESSERTRTPTTPEGRQQQRTTTRDRTPESWEKSASAYFQARQRTATRESILRDPAYWARASEITNREQMSKGLSPSELGMRSITPAEWRAIQMQFIAQSLPEKQGIWQQPHSRAITTPSNDLDSRAMAAAIDGASPKKTGKGRMYPGM